MIFSYEFCLTYLRFFLSCFQLQYWQQDWVWNFLTLNKDDPKYLYREVLVHRCLSFCLGPNSRLCSQRQRSIKWSWNSLPCCIHILARWGHQYQHVSVCLAPLIDLRQLRQLLSYWSLSVFKNERNFFNHAEFVLVGCGVLLNSSDNNLKSHWHYSGWAATWSDTQHLVTRDTMNCKP